MPKKKNNKTQNFRLLKLLGYSLLGVVAGFLIGVVFYTVTINSIAFELNGDDEVKVKLDSDYVDEGYVSLDINKDISSHVTTIIYKTTGEKVELVDTKVLSSYIISYHLEYEKNNNKIDLKLIRYVSVVEEVLSSDELSFHFMELGNHYTGDSIYIKAGDTDILIDAGSRASSAPSITSYIDQYCTDNTLEYVIATHADQDHIAAFVGSSNNKGIFDYYQIETIIDFPRTDKSTQVKNNYVELRDKEVSQGANHYTALECYKESKAGAKRIFEIADGITMEILYNYYYENKSSDENNYSVCLLFSDGKNNFLFTGDLEEDGEKRLVVNNDLPEVKLYKAGHHGSKTSSTKELMDVVKPEIVVFTCCAGSPEYTETNVNQFPTQVAITNISKYALYAYVTSLYYIDSGNNGFTSYNGNIVVSSLYQNITVNCSNNNNNLKDTQWFKENRVWG